MLGKGREVWHLGRILKFRLKGAKMNEIRELAREDHKASLREGPVVVGMGIGIVKVMVALAAGYYLGYVIGRGIFWFG